MRERRHVSDQKIGLLSTANRIESDSREFNHAALPDRERQSLSRQMGVELDKSRTSTTSISTFSRTSWASKDRSTVGASAQIAGEMRPRFLKYFQTSIVSNTKEIAIETDKTSK